MLVHDGSGWGPLLGTITELQDVELFGLATTADATNPFSAVLNNACSRAGRSRLVGDVVDPATDRLSLRPAFRCNRARLDFSPGLEHRQAAIILSFFIARPFEKLARVFAAGRG